MRKAHAYASFSLLVVVATIITQIPVSKPPLAHARGSDSFATPTRVVSQAAKQQLVENYGRLPLSFEANHGQSDGSVKFLSRGSGYTLFLTANEAVLTLRRSQESEVRSQNQSRDREGAGITGPQNNPQITQISQILQAGFQSASSAKSVDEPAVLRLKLVGANPNPEVAGENELPGKSNYFLGNDPLKWRTNVSTYAKVRYKDVYPGIDLVYYGKPAPAGRDQRQLEYDFVVAPGADPRAIRLAFPSRARKQAVNPNGDPRQAGADRDEAVPLRIDGQGDLVLEARPGSPERAGAEGSELRLHQPVIYQEISGARQRIDGNFVIRGKPGQVHGRPSDASAKEGERQVGFEVARYDASKPLIIDPVLC